MVEKASSLRRPVSSRRASSFSTASISVSLPDGASRASQARKRVTAAPSRRCAARVPAISAAFFTAFMSEIGSGPTSAAPPALSMRRTSATAPLSASIRTFAFADPSASSAPGSVSCRAMSATAPMAAPASFVTFAGSRNTVGRPSAGITA